MTNLIAIFMLSIVGGAARTASFCPPTSTISTHRKQNVRTVAKLSPNDLLLDPAYIGGSFLWALDFYYGFDWLLAPLGTGLDSDFNPAYRTATFFGSILAGNSPGEAFAESSGPIMDDEGDRPEMGSRIGSGANVGYVTAVENDDIEGADWLSDRKAGLRSSAPLPLQVFVAALYAVVGLLAMAVTDSVQTAAVLAIPALVYEIGRPSLPNREEAIFDAKLDKAVTAFASERMLVYGQEILPEGVTPVKRDEATNEREIVNVFRREILERQDAPFQNSDVSDFQIEMRFREIGTGRSEAGFIKGIRLLREPVSWQ